MLNHFGIKNFKSIKNLELNCKRINIFIGEPNTGKSNILEAIGLLSHISYGYLANFVRRTTNKDLRKTVSTLFKKFGYSLVFKPAEGIIEVQKQQEDIITSIPYALSSET